MKQIKFLFLLIFFISCTTVKEVKVRDTTHFTQPPEPYIPESRVTSTKQLLKEYNRTVKIILEHEFWYDLNFNTNYYSSETNF